MSDADSQRTGAEQSDTNDATIVPDSLAEHVAAVTEHLGSLSDDELEAMDDVDLVELRTEIKDLEDRVEEVRKQQVDAEVKTRVEPGERFYGLSHIQSHSKYVTADPSTVVGRAVAQGIEYDSFVSVKASKLAEEAPDLAEVHESEYTYLR